MNPIMAVFSLRCPKCRTGKLFSSKTYSLGFTNMNTSCPACGFQFEIEPGFFWGAMYISYAVTIAISFVLTLLIYLLLQTSNIWIYIISIVSVLVLLAPFNFRLSRALMLYLFAPVKYDPDALEPKNGNLNS